PPRLPQWLIIHGRFPAAPFTTPAVAAFGRQHGHPAPCDRVDRGAWALRSLTAAATRRAPSIPASCGSVSVRGAACPQHGQSAGRSYAAIGRTAENIPHVPHS
ncbi:MAG TPA: hypothetical protein VGG99_08105, partial [Acetobacteraceae bacterium]